MLALTPLVMFSEAQEILLSLKALPTFDFIYDWSFWYFLMYLKFLIILSLFSTFKKLTTMSKNSPQFWKTHQILDFIDEQMF